MSIKNHKTKSNGSQDKTNSAQHKERHNTEALKSRTTLLRRHFTASRKGKEDLDPRRRAAVGTRRAVRSSPHVLHEARVNGRTPLETRVHAGGPQRGRNREEIDGRLVTARPDSPRAHDKGNKLRCLGGPALTGGLNELGGIVHRLLSVPSNSQTSGAIPRFALACAARLSGRANYEFAKC